MDKTPQKFSYESMGSHFEITIWDSMNPASFLAIQNTIIKDSNDFDQKYSRFIKTSFVRSIEGKLGEFDVDKDFMAMLKVYFDFYELSEKKFNPLIGFTVSDMGYDEKYTLIPKSVIRETFDLRETIKIIGDSKIRVLKPVLFDLGGVGKGYFVDKIADFLKQKGVKRFLVNGSGDIVYEGAGQVISAGLEHPTDETKVVGKLDIAKGSLCASGISRRNWGKYHHIINPLLLSSPTEILSTWVLSDTAVLSDVLATCLFLCSPKNFSSHFRFEYCILNKDFSVQKSPGFTAQLF